MFLSGFVFPRLAEKLAWCKHAFTTASSLFSNLVVPLLVIVYLDTKCYGNWVALWQPCIYNANQFQITYKCMTGECEPLRDPGTDILASPALSSKEMCPPSPSCILGSISMSRCIELVLLRLQDIWLSKFVTSGFVFPGWSPQHREVLLQHS